MKQIDTKLKETVERVFSDAKESMAGGGRS
jgi:hypothetical protein